VRTLFGGFRSWILAGASIAAAALIGLQVADYGPQLQDEPRVAIFDDPSLRATVAPNRAVYGGGFDIAVPDAHKLRPLLDEAAGSCTSLFDAAIEAGGFNIDATHLKLDVEGHTPRERKYLWAKRRDVTIVGMRAKIVSRGARRNGIRVVCFGGGQSPRIGLFFQLDDDEPHAQAVDQEGRPTHPYFESKTVEVRNTETESFKITGTTSRSVEWKLELDLIIDGKETTQTIPPAGEQPFRTTGRLSGGPDAGAYRGQVAFDPFTTSPSRPTTTGMKR
jgi:hypothetical protein